MSALFFLSFFLAVNAYIAKSQSGLDGFSRTDRVVIAAPILVALYAGDRYLAANIETIRLAATSVDRGEVDSGYLMRAQSVVAQLNPCHEDNYYLANGLLAWGGAVNEGNQVLKAAINCRSWDFVPPFFYGVNLAFFGRDVPAAQQALEVAAQRSPQNAAGLRKLAIMLQAEQISDAQLALDYLVRQRDTTTDPALRAMLDKRVIRLQGLVTLRAAQREYEAMHGPLIDLNQLVSSRLLEALPVDPLRLGYQLSDGQVMLKQLKIAGMEEQP
jgi:hypothetical protein